MMKIKPLELFEKLCTKAKFYPNYNNVDKIGIFIHRLSEEDRKILNELKSNETENQRLF